MHDTVVVYLLKQFLVNEINRGRERGSHSFKREGNTGKNEKKE